MSSGRGTLPVGLPAIASGKFPEMEDIAQRIQARIDHLGTNPSAVSLAAGFGRDFLRDLTRGKKTQMSADAAQRIAAELKCSVNWLLYGTGSPEEVPEDAPPPAQGIRYGGIVEAGAFRTVDLLDQDGDGFVVQLSPLMGYPASKQVAFRVEGDSMDLEGILPGMWVQAVELEYFEKMNGPAPDGAIVVVENPRNGDIELTVKKLRVYRDRYELHPHSSNPKHKAFVFPFGNHEEESGPQVKAVVLAATRVYRDPTISRR